jgi:membrane-associated phospholipid phosphatase
MTIAITKLFDMIAILSPIIALFINALFSIKFTIYLLIFGFGLNSLLKYIISLSHNPVIFRPINRKYGCGIDPFAVVSNGMEIGMPSGHSQIMSLIATFWTLYLFKTNNKYKIWIMLLLLGMVGLINWSRIAINCHTLLQVIVGNIIGIIFGIIGFIIFC